MRAVLLSLFLCSLAQAATISDTEPPIIADDRMPVAGERTDRLPEDGQAWHTTLFINDPPTARDNAVFNWFRTDAELVRLAKQTHFQVISPRSSTWVVYSSVTQSLPCVWVANDAGKRVSKHSGDTCHLDSAAALKRALSVDMRAFKSGQPASDCHPFRPEPPYNPPYSPPVNPFDKPLIPDNPGPDDEDVVEPEGKADRNHWAVIAFAVFAVTLAFAYVKDRQAQTY